MLVPLILRKIRLNRWYPREECSWLKEGELQADPLGDLQTTQNALSVWCVKDDESNRDRIITALAANCQHIANLDYILFSKQVVSELNIEFANSEAETPDREANHWHYDLVRLSAQKLVELVTRIIDDVEPKRVPPRRIRELIRQAVNSGRIPLEDLEPGIRKKL